MRAKKCIKNDSGNASDMGEECGTAITNMIIGYWVNVEVRGVDKILKMCMRFIMGVTGVRMK